MGIEPTMYRFANDCFFQFSEVSLPLRSEIGIPDESRTRIPALRGQFPRPLEDRDIDWYSVRESNPSSERERLVS